MIHIRQLTLQLRKELKKPLGTLIQGSLDEIISELKTLIKEEKPPKIVTVGDRVSQELTNHNILPDVLIVDNKIMRKRIPPISATADRILHVKNPPGTITNEAWTAIKLAMEKPQRTKIVVEGEEDLLALVAILTAPENAFVLYGQPREGIVTIKATAEMKQKIQQIVETMEKNSQKN